MLQSWLLLLLSLPPRPSSLRVRAWRRLKALGAVALKSGAYLLPDSPDRYEQFQWLAQEVEKDRGEATLLKVDRVENMKQPEVVRLFQEARDADYADLTDRYRKLGATKGPAWPGSWRGSRARWTAWSTSTSSTLPDARRRCVPGRRRNGV